MFRKGYDVNEWESIRNEIKETMSNDQIGIIGTYEQYLARIIELSDLET